MRSAVLALLPRAAQGPWRRGSAFSNEVGTRPTRRRGTILALNVTDHGACSIGGEVPVIVYDADKGEVKTLSGQGRAPLSRKAIDWYMENGIPDKDIKMAPVPSVVDLCITLLRRYGTRTFAEIVAPTLAILDAAEESWHPRLAVTLRRLAEAEQAARGSREEKLAAASDRFYGRNGARQDVADELEADYVEKGGFLRKADLAAHRTLIEDSGYGQLPGIRRVQMRPVDAGAVSLPGPAPAGGLRPEIHGPSFRGLRARGCRSDQAGHGRQGRVLRRPRLCGRSVDRIAVGRIYRNSPAADRYGEGVPRSPTGGSISNGAAQRDRCVRTGHRRNDHVRGRGPLGECRFGNAERERIPRRGSPGRADGGCHTGTG